MENSIIKFLFERKNEGKGLKKKAGLDKLVITIILICIGIGVCYIFRNNISTFMTTTFAALTTQATNLVNGSVNGTNP